MVGFAVYNAVTADDADPRDRVDEPPPSLEREGSEQVDAPVRDLDIGPGPAAYAVTYEVREPARSSTEDVAVVRPFASRRTTPTDVSVTAFGRLHVTPRSGAPTIVSPPPAAIDPRPRLVVDRAVREGLLERREQRRVEGRRCQVFRSRAPVSSSTISAPWPRHYTDICISAEGLVLEEWQVEDGRGVRQRRALDIVSRAEVEPVTRQPTVTAAQGGGSVLRVDPASRPEGRFYDLDAPPAGFTRRGRYSVVPPQAGLTDEQERRRAVASTADVFERGADVIVVDRGSTLNLDPAFRPRPEGRRVDDLGPAFDGAAGELLLSWTGPEVRWGDEDGRFVRVYGTVEVDVLVATMRSLRVTEGGTGLTFTGEPL